MIRPESPWHVSLPSPVSPAQTITLTSAAEPNFCLHLASDKNGILTSCKYLLTLPPENRVPQPVPQLSLPE